MAQVRTLNVIRWGIQNGHQRFRCKECGLMFTPRRPDVSSNNRLYVSADGCLASRQLNHCQKTAEIGCINDGEIAVGKLASFFYALFNVETKDCYCIYSNLKLRKNDSCTYFLDPVSRFSMSLCLTARERSSLYMWKMREWNARSATRDGRICA